MTTTANSDFINWLNNKLCALNTDESVFGAYIIGLLEGDETNEEKAEALEGLLSEIIEKDLQNLSTEILHKWQEYHPQVDTCSKPTNKDIDVNKQLAKLLEGQKLQTVKERQLTEEEAKIKQQILAQYSKTEISDDDCEESGDENKAIEKGTKSSSSCGLERNTNAENVLQKQKERREQARLESAAKKQKDKEDREKQKQQREEKKEKRKTVKGERRR